MLTIVIVVIIFILIHYDTVTQSHWIEMCHYEIE